MNALIEVSRWQREKDSGRADRDLIANAALIRFATVNRWWTAEHGQLPSLSFYQGVWTASARFGNGQDELNEAEADTPDAAFAKLLKIFGEIEMERQS